MSGPVYPPEQPPVGGNPPYPTQQPSNPPYPTQQPSNPPYPPQQPSAYGFNPYPPAQHGGPPQAPPPSGYDPKMGGAPAPQNHVTINIHQGVTQPQAMTGPTEPDFSQFGEKAVRLGFIKKVYAILACQLLLTFGIACIFFFPESVKQWNYDNPGLLIGSCIASLVLIIVLACVPGFRRKSPQNYIVLFLFTACEGVMIGSVCAYYDSDDVLKAVVTTIIIVVALTLFAFQTKIDFTMTSGLLFSFLMGLLLFGIMAAIYQTKVMNSLYAALGAIIFSMYIVVDTQLMMGGKHKLTISPEEYVFAALNLYLDILNLFLMLLRLFGN